MHIEKVTDIILCVSFAALTFVAFAVPADREGIETTASEPVVTMIPHEAQEVDPDQESKPGMAEEDVLAYLNKNANPGGEWKKDTGSCIVFYPSGDFAEGLSLLHEYPDEQSLLEEYGKVLDAFCDIGDTINKVASEEYSLALADPLNADNVFAEISDGQVTYDAFGAR